MGDNDVRPIVFGIYMSVFWALIFRCDAKCRRTPFATQDSQRSCTFIIGLT